MNELESMNLAGNFNHPLWSKIAKDMLEWTAEDTGLNPSMKLDAIWRTRLEKLNRYLQEIVCDMVAEYVFTGQAPILEEGPAQTSFHREPVMEGLAANLREFERLERAGGNQAIRDAVWNKHLRELFRTLQMLIQETYAYNRQSQKDAENQHEAAAPVLHPAADMK